MRTGLQAGFNADEDGSASIETAAAFLLMMSCVLGIIGFSLMVYTCAVYEAAARYGMRYATVHGSDSANCSGPTTGCGDLTAANVITQVTAFAALYTAPISGTQVQVAYPDTGGCTPPSRVNVTVTYTYASPFKQPRLSYTFQAFAQGRIMY